MRKRSHVTNEPDTPTRLPSLRIKQPGSSKRRTIFGTSLALLAVLLIVLAWIVLAHQLHPGPHPASSAPAATQVAARAQVEPPRRDSAMAYDPAQHVVLLFGGTVAALGGAVTNETWAWDGQTWQQLHPASSPPPLPGTMVYDTASGHIVLLLNQIQNGSVANEMWTWDGTTWHQLHPATMPEVLGASLADDEAHRQLVLFGGEVPFGHVGTRVNTTWTWDGTTWQQQHPAVSPSPRTDSAMAYDAAQQAIVLYGGITDNGISFETWTWNGATWQQQHPASTPTERQDLRLVYDNATQQTLLFGGLSVSGGPLAVSDTWTWNGTTWLRVASQGAPDDPFESAAYDDATQTIIVYAVQGVINKLATPGVAGPVSQTWVWNGTTWSLLS